MEKKEKKHIFNNLVDEYDQQILVATSSFYNSPETLIRFRTAALFELAEKYRKEVNQFENNSRFNGKKEIVYTVGAIGSNPNWKPKFRDAKKKYEGLDYIVLSPLDHTEGMSYKKYMKLGLDYVFKADKIIVLKGWENSPGTKAELALAECLGTIIIFD